MLAYFPKYFTKPAITTYLLVMAIVTVVFLRNAMSVMWMVFGILEVVSFFHFSNVLTKKWATISTKLFEKKIFRTALIIRVFYVVFSYIFYSIVTGQPFEYATADAFGYHGVALWLKDMVWNGTLSDYFISAKGGYSDTGYPLFLAIQYSITGSSIIIARLLKALLSAYMCVFIYKLATRNFGEQVGRMAAIFAMLLPHFIYYCGLHLKETEMIFLAVLFLERADYLFRSKSFSFKNILIILVTLLSLFFFRTVLGVAAIFAIATAILFSDAKIINKSKRLFMSIWILLTVVVFLGGAITAEIEETWGKKDEQQANMQWRSERKGGNEFAKYAGAAVFAPLIFTIPFPTMVHIDDQENQIMVNGNNYVKNVLSFFVILSVFLIIKNKQLRQNPFILSFLVSYLGILAISHFAQSERFHLPAMPIYVIFAAYGISLIKPKYKQYFTWWLAFLVVVIIGWNWFKLAGRGLA